MLAMEVNDNAGSLTPRGVLRFFASRLAPTVVTITFSVRLHQPLAPLSVGGED